MEDTYVSRETWLDVRMSNLAELDGISLWTLGRVTGPVRAQHDTSCTPETVLATLIKNKIKIFLIYVY
jgi:hypothetical protein